MTAIFGAWAWCPRCDVQFLSARSEPHHAVCPKCGDPAIASPRASVSKEHRVAHQALLDRMAKERREVEGGY